MRVLTDDIRPGEPLEVEVDAAGELTLACDVREHRALTVTTRVAPGRHTLQVPPGPSSHDGELVPVVWTLRLDGGEPVRLRVLPGRTPPPTAVDRLARIEPTLRAIWDTLRLGAFVAVILGVVGAWVVLDPSLPSGARAGIGLVLLVLSAWFAWLPLTTLSRWARAATVPVPAPPRPLRPGATWAPKAKLRWRLERVESRFVRTTRTRAGSRFDRWRLVEHRVAVAEGGPEDAVRLPLEGPVDARVGRAAVGWEWVAWRPDRPGVVRRVRLEVR